MTHFFNILCIIVVVVFLGFVICSVIKLIFTFLKFNRRMKTFKLANMMFDATDEKIINFCLDHPKVAHDLLASDLLLGIQKDRLIEISNRISFY